MWAGTMLCEIMNSTGGTVNNLYVWHQSGDGAVDKPANNGSITIPSGNIFTFTIGVSDSNDLWSILFRTSGHAALAGASDAAYVGPPAPWWWRFEKVCSITSDDYDSGKPVILNLMYGDDGWSVDLPVSSNCAGNFYNGPSQTPPTIPGNLD